MTDLTAPAARALLPEWSLALTAERKSSKTIVLYLDAVGRYLTWTETQDLPPMRRISLQTWITTMLDTGRSPSTARIRQQAARRYAAWLTAVGHLDAAPFQGMTGPKLDQPVVDPLTVAEVRALLQTCVPGSGDDPSVDRSLRHVRDEAIIRLMVETGIRLSEVIALTAPDLDLAAGLVTIRRGKGGRGRVIPVGPATTAAIHAYLAVRRTQPHADRVALGRRTSLRTRSRRPLPLPAPTRRAGRHHRIPSPPTPPHRSPPLARRRRLRIRPDGHGRLDPRRHAHSVHPRRSLRTRRRRGATLGPRNL